MYIITKEEIISDQKDWDDSDLSKNFDFTIYDFWIVFGDGKDPIGFDSYDEAKREIENND